MGDLGSSGSADPRSTGPGDFTTCALPRGDRQGGPPLGSHSRRRGLGINPLAHFGTAAQQARWLPDLLAGRALAAFGLTESEAGSDAGATRTRATLRDHEWVINGSKQFITNSGTDITSLCTITARTGTRDNGKPEISAIVVPTGTAGFVVGPSYAKLGWHASDTHPLTFTDVRVPEDHLLGERGARGIRNACRSWMAARCDAALALGCIRACPNCRPVRDAATTFGVRLAAGKASRSNCDLDVMAAAAHQMVYAAGRHA